MRVLVVDDDQGVVEAICGLITPLGHDAVGVTSGQDALDSFQRSRYDLVIVDVVMPAMNGLEVMRHLRAMDRTIRLVALTGTGLDFGGVLDEAGIRFVHKPIWTTDAVVDLLAVR